MARITIEVNTKQAQKAIKAMEDALEDADIDIIKLEKDAKRTGKSIRQSFSGLGGMIGGLFVGAGIIAGVKGIVTVTDEYTNLNSRLKTVTDSSKDLAFVEKELYKQSQKTGTSYAANADSYARLSGALKDAGAKSREILGITELVNKSLIVNGSSAAEAGAFMTQFSQAMGSGVLQGDELKSILESNATFARELAKAFDTDIAGLRKMGSQGELTAEKIRKAFPKMAEEINKSFGQIELTVGRAMTEVENAFKKVVFEGNNAVGGNKRLAESIRGIARTLEENGDVFADFFVGAVVGVDIAIKAFGLLKQGIGVSVGGILLLASHMSEAWDKAWLLVTEGGAAAFDAIRLLAAKSIDDIVAKLNKLPFLDIEIDTTELQGNTKKLIEFQEKFKGITREAEQYRESIRETQNEHKKAFGTKLTQLIEFAKNGFQEQKKVIEENKTAFEDVSKARTDLQVVYDKTTGQFITQSAAEVEAVKKVKDALEDVAAKEYTAHLKVIISEERSGTAGAGGFSFNPSPSGTQQTSGGSGGTVNVNMNMPGSSQSIPMTTSSNGASQLINEVNKMNRRQS